MWWFSPSPADKFTDEVESLLCTTKPQLQKVKDRIWPKVFSFLTYEEKCAFAKVCTRWERVFKRYLDRDLDSEESRRHFREVWSHPRLVHLRNLTDVCSDQKLKQAGDLSVVVRPTANRLLVFRGVELMANVRTSELYETGHGEDPSTIDWKRARATTVGEYPVCNVTEGPTANSILVYTSDRVAAFELDGGRRTVVDVIEPTSGIEFLHPVIGPQGTNVDGVAFRSVTKLGNLCLGIDSLSQATETSKSPIVRSISSYRLPMADPVCVAFPRAHHVFGLLRRGGYSVCNLGQDVELLRKVQDRGLARADSLRMSEKIIAVSHRNDDRSQAKRRRNVIRIINAGDTYDLLTASPIYHPVKFDRTQFDVSGNSVVFVDQTVDRAAEGQRRMRTEAVVFNAKSGTSTRFTLALETMTEFKRKVTGGSIVKAARSGLVLVGYRDHLYAIHAHSDGLPPKKGVTIHCPQMDFTTMHIRPNGTDIVYLHKSTRRLQILSVGQHLGALETRGRFVNWLRKKLLG